MGRLFSVILGIFISSMNHGYPKVGASIEATRDCFLDESDGSEKGKESNPSEWVFWTVLRKENFF